MLVDGEREWVEWTDIAFDDGDFPECGAAFERERPEAVERGAVGDATLMVQRELVDFGVGAPKSDIAHPYDPAE